MQFLWSRLFFLCIIFAFLIFFMPMDDVLSVDAIDADSKRSLEMAGDKDAQSDKDATSPFDEDWTVTLAGLNADNIPDDMIEDLCKILEPAAEEIEREFSSFSENREYTSSPMSTILCSQNANEAHDSGFYMSETESSVAGSSTNVEDCHNSYAGIDNLTDELHDDLSGCSDFDDLLEELGHKRSVTVTPGEDDMLHDSIFANMFDTYSHPGEYLSQIGWHEDTQQNAFKQLNDDGFLDWMKHALLNGPY